MNFENEMKKRRKEVDEVLESYLPCEEGYQKTVLSAMNYSMRAGGKRLRPMLMQETWRLFGGTGKTVEPFMAAIEMIHTHSLIHDDLPALDNDEYRRGKKTTHVVFGEAMAILAGDALLNYAYETAAKAFAIEPENKAIGQAFALLAGRTGVYGMLGGQCADVEAAGRSIERERLDFIYRLKTGALIEASMMVGAVLAGASEEELEMVRQIASDVGLAFQIQDDILDVISTTEELGKPVRSDEKNEKTTYVTLEGIAKAKEDVKELSDRAIRTLKEIERRMADRLLADGVDVDCENNFLEELLRRLIDRKK